MFQTDTIGPEIMGIETEETAAEARTGDGRTGETGAEVKVTLRTLHPPSLSGETTTGIEG